MLTINSSAQDAPELQSPVALLNARAALLSAQTNGVVTDEMRAELDPDGEQTVANFYLVGEQINYRYLLLRATYPAELYPAKLECKPLWPDAIIVADEAELDAKLDEIFGAAQTRAVIEAIVERSQDEDSVI